MQFKKGVDWKAIHQLCCTAEPVTGHLRLTHQGGQTPKSAPEVMAVTHRCHFESE